MKKTILAAAVLSAAMSAHAGTTMFGSVEQRVEMSNGVWDINGDDNFVGVKASEDLGNGASAYAVISLDVNTDGGASTTRDAYVGIDFGGVAVQAGRQINFIDAADDATTDIFEGTSLTADGADRNDSMVSVTTKAAGVTLGGAVISDNGGEDKTDAYQISAGAEVGPASIVGVYAKDKTTDEVTKLAGVSGSVGALSVAGTYEIAADDAVTMTGVASVDLGTNTLKGGIEDVEDGAQTYVLEAVHNFSKQTSAYVNYSDSDADDAESVTMVGMRVNF